MHAVKMTRFHLSQHRFTGGQRRARVTRVRTILTLFVIACAALPACSRAREYELRGQILAVDRQRQEITIRHEDIRGFMPGMTMPFKVRETRLLEGHQVGDLVRATLVVKNQSAYLSSVERTGHAELTAPPPAMPRIELLEPGQSVPDVRLIDETGASHPISAWRGRVVAVTFIYTRCPLPDFCPAMDRHFAAVQRDVLADPVMRDRTALLSISFDPAFDTPRVLAEHARRAGADPRVWHFATGDQESVAAFAARFGMSIFREGADASGITHNLRTAVIATDGTLSAILDGTEWTPADLLKALRQAR
jgi:protein SCO1